MNENGAEAQSGQAQVTIARTSPDDVQQRQIIVIIDKQKVGELMYGEAMTIPLSPGQHRLKVDNTWNWKTIDLDLAAGDHVGFRVKSRVGRWTWFLVATLGAGPMYVSIERES